MPPLTAISTGLFQSRTSRDGALLEIIREVYGEHPELVEERAQAWRRTVNAFLDRFGPRDELLLIRAPARANLIGKHSDFQGGRSNCICLPSEMLIVASPRDDDRLVIRDARPELFPEMSTSVGELMPPRPNRRSWNEFLVEASRTVEGTRWINYKAGPFVYLQNRFPEMRIRGIDAVVLGNIVSAAGLSSSSALSVAGMLAASTFNGIDRPWNDLAIWAGEAEWLSGTRGGAGDHAAILLTPAGRLVHMRTRPAVELQAYPFPDKCEVVAIYSGKPAIKSSIANRNIYNTHSVSYRFGVEWLRRELDGERSIEMIADLLDPAFGLSERDVLDAIALLPERATRAQLRRRLQLGDEAFEEMTCSHDEPQAGYPIRRVCLYGVAEFSRSARVPALLEAADVRELGRMMTISHDGDRVVHSDHGRLRPYDNDVGDERIDALRRQASEKPGEFPMLPDIPGGYGNSCPELDELVDYCLRLDGVYGAGLTGAGMGGHLLALVERGGASRFIETLQRDYFEALGVPGCAYPCPPMGGATMHRLG